MHRNRCLVMVALVSGCGASELSQPPPDAGGDETDAAADASPPQPPGCPAPRVDGTLLSRAEYQLTVRDLLGDLNAPTNLFPLESEDHLGLIRFGSATNWPTTPDWYVKAADTLAAAALARLGTLLTCDPLAIGEVACANQFIASFGKRAYRRPLAADEAARLKDAYATARLSGSFPAGIAAIIATALKSPHFLQIEIDGTSGRPIWLNSYELASRLSYFVYHSMPDADLFAAADAGQLTTAEEIARQAQRMLLDKKAVDGLNVEVSRWLALNRLDRLATGPDVSADQASLYRDMKEETLRFVRSAFFNRGTVRDLLRGTETWLNEPLATLYGVPGIAGPDFRRVNLDPAVRSGLLTQASLLTVATPPNQTLPTTRGTFVVNRLLCTDIPEAPNSVLLQPIVPDPGESKRQAYTRVLAKDPCAACHSITDPFGFALEPFDTVGQFRASDHGLPIDPSGTLSWKDLKGSFGNAVELAELMSTSDLAWDCVALQWLVSALHRDPLESADDVACATRAVGLRWGKHTLVELITAIVRDPAFRAAPGCYHPCSLTDRVGPPLNGDGARSVPPGR